MRRSEIIGTAFYFYDIIKISKWMPDRVRHDKIKY